MNLENILVSFALIDIMPITGHLGYVFTALAFMLRDILWLRVFAVGASAFNLVYSYGGGAEPDVLAVTWEGLLIGINSVHIYILLKAILEVNFTRAEKRIYREVFRAFKPVDFHKFVRMGHIETFKKGDVIAVQGEELGTLYLIYKGKVRVEKDGDIVTDLGPYAFVGEIAFTTDRKASATVEVLKDSKIYTWDFDAIEGLLGSDTTIRLAFQSCVGVDMAKKLGVQH